ncbi:MAG: serine hydrolase [Acidimicrobiales bacterium]|jgi:CubicO group peptidase (beta-lactamase class C family)|nr:serine hydrolase [Acidimicrobiales bacterium]
MSTLVPERVTKLLDRCRREVDEGRIPGCQVAVGFEGEVAVFEAFGDLTTDARLHTYSAIKPTVSLTVMELAAEGLLDLDAPVSSVLDSFSTNGKQAITLSQVLLHAGGFPHAPIGPEEFVDRDARLGRYASWRTTWEPGTAFEYHASAAHWVLADCITEVTGRHHADVITERVMAPAGCSRWLAIPEDEQGNIADVVSVGDPPDLEAMASRFGIETMPVTEVTDDALLRFNVAEVRAVGHPGGGGIASAAEMALWYQAVMHDEGEMLRHEVKTDALEVVRQRHPDWMGTAANRTHAFTLSGDDGQALMRGYGHGVGPVAFGHGGAKGQRAYADPSTGISLGFMTHGLDRDELVHAKRCAGVASAAGLLTTPLD